MLEVLPVLVALPVGLSVVRHSRHDLSIPEIASIALAVLLALAARWVQLGYLRRIALGVFTGDRSGLPAWDQLERDVAEGCRLWLVSLGVFLPLLAAAAGVVLLFSAVGLRPLGVAVLVPSLPVAALAALLYLPAGLLATVESGSMAAAFDVGQVMRRLHAVLAPYLLAVAVAVAAEILAQLGLMVACVGVFFTRFAAHCITVHAFASAWASAPAFQAPILAGAERE